MIPVGAVCGCALQEWMARPAFLFHEIKGILEKKAALAKLSFPGKCRMEKLIVRGVGIPRLPTDCLSSPGQAASSLSSGKGDKH